MKMLLTSSPLASVVILATLLAAATFPVSTMALIDLGMGRSFEDEIHGMVTMGDLTEEQSTEILSIMGESALEKVETHAVVGKAVASNELLDYLNEQVAADAMKEEASLSIRTMLRLIPVEPEMNPAPSAAADSSSSFRIRSKGARNKNTQETAAVQAQAVNVQALGTFRSAQQSKLGFRNYNGIWGYTASDGTEYALLCHSLGIDIVNVAVPSSPAFVQFIPMPGGDIWRDVATHFDEASGKTYAYVAGQTSAAPLANLWILDLSFLPNEIPSRTGYKMVPGYLEDGHTVNVDDGFLFLNTAIPTRGIKILDLMEDPYNPTYIAQYVAGDGHDSFYKKGVIVNGIPRNVLIASDGYTMRSRFVDLTDLREIHANEGFVLIGRTSELLISETRLEVVTYQHSSAVTDDAKYVYLFEEFNRYDMVIYDIREATTPVRVGTFQWSGETLATNSIVHNGRVRGNLLFVAYYTVGLRVFDISTPTAPVEVGFYNTVCGDQSPLACLPLYGTYVGAWNVYTDLPSGNILMSDSRGGLFIFSV